MSDEGIGPPRSSTTDSIRTTGHTVDLCSRQAAALNREATLQAHCWEGRVGYRGVGCTLGRRDGEGYKRRLTPTFARGPLTVGPLWGRGPRPFSPFLAPSSVQHCLGHPPAPNRLTVPCCIFKRHTPAHPFASHLSATPAVAASVVHLLHLRICRLLAIVFRLTCTTACAHV